MKIYTEKDRIPYFVQPGFENTYPKDSSERKQVERNVRNDYVENLRNNCYQETLHGTFYAILNKNAIHLKYKLYSVFPKVGHVFHLKIIYKTWLTFGNTLYNLYLNKRYFY